MRFATIIVIVSLSARLAFAGADWGFKQIASYVDLAERRLGENDVASARFNLKSARDMMPEASAEAKADRGWPALEARIAKLDKAIAQREAAAARSEGAVDALRKADDNETQARFAAERDDYERAAALFQQCSADLEKAASTDPAITSQKGPRDASYAQMVTRCKDGRAEMLKRASSIGQDAPQTEQGKAALEGYAIASRVAAARKVQALELAAAIKGAEACDNNTGHLTSIRMRNNKPMYDGSKIKLGDLTIDDMHERCRKLVTELKAKPAFGCGRHYVDVSQDRASVVDRWNPVRDSGKQPFEAMECSEMPKRSVFPGAAAIYKSTYFRACGSDAIYIIQHNRWLEHPTQRQMSGECWKKGNLTFNR
ncbi:MAG TPA: hypothetical protein VGD80_35255 [Kofleriaceae bacterium]